jgi:hypothetical protein
MYIYDIYEPIYRYIEKYRYIHIYMYIYIGAHNQWGAGRTSGSMEAWWSPTQASTLNPQP